MAAMATSIMSPIPTIRTTVWKIWHLPKNSFAAKTESNDFTTCGIFYLLSDGPDEWERAVVSRADKTTEPFLTVSENIISWQLSIIPGGPPQVIVGYDWWYQGESQ